jgi:hypothetical protein
VNQSKFPKVFDNLKPRREAGVNGGAILGHGSGSVVLSRAA